MKAETRTYTTSGHEIAVRHYLSWVTGIVIVSLFIFSSWWAISSDKVSKIAQAKADREALRTELTVASSPYATLMTTEDGWIVQSNLAAELLLGWPHDDMVGKSAFDFIPRDDQERITREMNLAVVKMRSSDKEKFFLLLKESDADVIHHDGTQVPVMVSVRIIKFYDEVQFIIGMRAKSKSQEPIQPQQPVPLPELRSKGNAAIDRVIDQMAADYKQVD